MTAGAIVAELALASLSYAMLFARVVAQRVGARGLRGLRGMHPVIDPMVALLRMKPVAERAQPLLLRYRASLAELNGGACGTERLLRWAGESLGIAWATLFASGLLALLAGSGGVAGLGAIVAGGVPFLRAKELGNRVAARRQRIVLELPELLGKLLLVVNAGDNVMRALARCAEQQPVGANPLYDELKAALAAMNRGESMAAALEEMGRRCAVPEVKLFASTLLINARRGGEAFVPALKELTRQMWDKRKATVRTLGEQASSKLVFPLALIFLCIMILVGAPTILLF